MIANPAHSERQTHSSASAVYTGFEHQRVRFGAGFRGVDLYQTSEYKNFNAAFAPLPAPVQAAGNPDLIYILPHKRNLTYAFAQDEWSFARTDWQVAPL